MESIFIKSLKVSCKTKRSKIFQNFFHLTNWPHTFFISYIATAAALDTFKSFKGPIPCIFTNWSQFWRTNFLRPYPSAPKTIPIGCNKFKLSKVVFAPESNPTHQKPFFCNEFIAREMFAVRIKIVLSKPPEAAFAITPVIGGVLRSFTITALAPKKAAERIIAPIF